MDSAQDDSRDLEFIQILERHESRLREEAAYLHQNGKMSLEFEDYRIDYKYRRAFPNFLKFRMTADYFDIRTKTKQFSNQLLLHRCENSDLISIILFLANDERRKTFVRRLS